MSAFSAPSTTNFLGEIPLMSFRIGDAVTSIAIRRVRELVHGGRASLDGALVVLVYVLDVDVQALRRLAAEVLRIAIVTRWTTHHDHVPADLHRGVYRSAVRPSHALAEHMEAERFLEKCQRGVDVFVVQIWRDR